MANRKASKGLNKDELERKTLSLMLSTSITRASSFFTKLELELDPKNYKRNLEEKQKKNYKL